MNRLVLFILIIAALGGASCTKATDTPRLQIPTREVQDDLGRTVRVPEKIDRAISLAPSVTEMIFAVGAGEKLVGVTTYCNYPEAARKIEKIGDTQTPNIEKLVALKPQVVFVSTASQLEAFRETLDQQGIAVFVIDIKSLDDVIESLRQLGEVLDTRKAAQKEIESLSERIRRLDEKIDSNNHRGKEIGGEIPRVFVQMSNDPLFTIGKDSFITDLITKAGGVSVTKDVSTAYPTLSKEAAAALDPDLILLSDSEDNREPSSAFKDSKAVKNGRVYRINADIISRPGPRLVDALEEIAKRLRDDK